MKRLIATMFCLVLVLSLFGCGKAKSGDYPATMMVNGTNMKNMLYVLAVSKKFTKKP